MGLILPIVMHLSVAYAQEDDQMAKQLYLNGKMLFDEKRYEEAVTAWSKAYELSEKPVVLYNIAIAQEKLNLYEESITTLYQYRIYAARDEQEDLLAKITELEAKLVLVKAEEDTKSLDDSYLAEKVDDTQEEESEVTVVEVDTTPLPLQNDSTIPELTNLPQPTMSPIYIAWGVSAASLTSGIVFGVTAKQASELAEYAGGCATTDIGILLCTEDSEGEQYTWEAQQKALIADISYGITILSVGTATWLTIKHRQQTTQDVTSKLWFSTNGFGITGSF
jgi:tetratricopeptide (TPR) repeat protein